MKFFEELESYFSGQFNSLKMLFTLIKLEAKLAGLSVAPLIITLCMLFVILITFWASLMVLVGYFIFTQFNSFWLAICSTLLLNLLVLCFLLKYFIYNLKAMSFEKTRRYLNTQESIEHERLKKTTDCANK
jgi:hypothetical protein